MPQNPHFKTIANWKQAASMIDFKPRWPTFNAGFSLSSLSVHMMDHRKRKLPISRRSLEAHYNVGFAIDQKRAPSVKEAKRMALSTPYGSEAQEIEINGHEGRTYDLGPEPEPGDIDDRSPAVVVWSDVDLFYLIVSTQLEVDVLIRIAKSMY